MLKRILIFGGAIATSLMAGGFGSLATTPNISTWYEYLNKPALTPPNEIFGPVWSLLYIIMGTALAIVVLEKTKKSKKLAYIWYGVQLILNTLWSLVFFGLRQPWIAFVIIICLIASIIITMRTFHKIRPLATWLLIPYLTWISFATYLNIGIALLNG